MIPQTLRPLLEKRLVLKQLIIKLHPRDCRVKSLKGRAAALKWLLVVCFGYLGYKNARFGKIESHEAVTAWSRELLLQAKEVAEEMGHMVIHMYVDCLFVQKPGCRKAADFTPLLDAIAAQTGIPIALDGVYRWVAFLPSKRDARIPVPNRYFGVFQDGEIKYRGIELRRHDTDVPASQGVQAYDRYAYVSNNPLRFTDPSGHVPCQGDNFDDGPQCVAKNPKAYKNPNAYVEYKVILICGYNTPGTCGAQGQPLSPYATSGYQPYNVDYNPNDPQKDKVASDIGTYIDSAMSQQTNIDGATRGSNDRFIIIGHSAGADSAIILGDKYAGKSTISGLVLLDPYNDATIDGNVASLQGRADNAANHTPTFLGKSNDAANVNIAGAQTEGFPGAHMDIGMLSFQAVFNFLNTLPSSPWR